MNQIRLIFLSISMFMLHACNCGGGTDIVTQIKESCDDGILNQDEEDIDCGGVCRACPVEETCFDDIQNQGETGVDCGGPCDACPTCVDGIQNQGETAIDCGGPCQACATCNDGLQNGDEEDVDCGGPCQACPTCSDGIQNQDEEDIDCGGPSCAPCPTCEDGLQNGDETGPDCGGDMCVPCPGCDDGILNGDEEDVDCGGSSCTPCATCTDGIQNQGETGLDCGGPCTACPTCSDGVQNQGEEEIDCGGPCAACPTCSDGLQNQGEQDIDCGGPCNQCVYYGAISGTLCTTETYEGIVNGTVSVDVLIDGAQQTFETTTNTQGEFTLDPVPTGTHDVEVRAGNFFNTVENVSVSEGQTTVLGEDPNCTEPPTPVGNIVGNFCSPSEILGIANALVTTQYVNDDGQLATAETYTDTNGDFILEDLPEGIYIVTITKNSFIKQVTNVVVVPGQDNGIVTEACVAPEPPRMRVFTGRYDKVEDVLEFLGYTPEIVVINDPIIAPPFTEEGDWIKNNFNDLSTFQDVDILFFNCRNIVGINNLRFWDSINIFENVEENVMNNLRSFVREGGSIYFSDRSYDIMEMGFPDGVNWVGDDDDAGAAHAANPQVLDATVVADDILATTIRSSLDLEIDLSGTAVAQSLSTNSRALVTSEVTYTNPDTNSTINGQDIPIVLEHTPFPNEEGSGKVIFTSVHNHDGSAEVAGSDMTLLVAAIIYAL